MATASPLLKKGAGPTPQVGSRGDYGGAKGSRQSEKQWTAACPGQAREETMLRSVPAGSAQR